MSRNRHTQNRLIGFGVMLIIGLPLLGCNTFRKSATRFANAESVDSAEQHPIAAQISVAKAAESKRDQYPARVRREQQQESKPNSFADSALLEVAAQDDQQQVRKVSHDADQAPLQGPAHSFQTSHKEETDGSNTSIRDLPEAVPHDAVAEGLSADLLDDEHELPIDLANALGIAGANNLDIRFARERVVAAHAEYGKAKVLWLPTIRLGIGFNKHDGRIQNTRGTVIDANRNSLFVGGGLGLGGVPLQGGAGGPARLFVNLSLADTIFNPLIEKQRLGYSRQNESVVTNETLLNVSLAYFDLLEAYGRLANASVSLESAEELVSLTADFESEGAGSKAEVERATAEYGAIKQQVAEAERVAGMMSARLKRLIRYESPGTLVPADLVVLPVSAYGELPSVDHLVAEGLTARNELHRQIHSALASEETLERECWRPLLPNVQLGVSGGMFGGGVSTQFNEGARSDIEVLAVWELENMGVGTAFERRQAASFVRQSHFQVQSVRDQIVEEITIAAHNVKSYRDQLSLAETAMKAAQASYEMNRERIRVGEGLPIEMLHAIDARWKALDAYTHAVTKYNQSQFQLIRAVGRVPAI